MSSSVYQIKTIETKGSEFPCLEYLVSLSLRQKVGGRLWVMSYVSLGNTIEIHFTTDFLTKILLMQFLCLLFCDSKNCSMWWCNRGNSNHPKHQVMRNDMKMKDKARYEPFCPMRNIFQRNSCQGACMCLFVHQNAVRKYCEFIIGSCRNFTSSPGLSTVHSSYKLQVSCTLWCISIRIRHSIAASMHIVRRRGEKQLNRQVVLKSASTVSCNNLTTTTTTSWDIL